MRTLILIAILLAQLDPSLVPRKLSRPTLPRVDEHACPFEGCRFGKWTVRQDVALYSTWKRNRTVVGRLRKGQVVTATTGINITFEPSEILVTAPIPQYNLQPGDLVFGYMNVGEGFLNAWFNGFWVDLFDSSAIAPGCVRNCAGKFVKPGRYEWWVRIRFGDRLTGWSNQTDRFDGKDALGG